jgi:hypothetical protein
MSPREGVSLDRNVRRAMINKEDRAGIAGNET